MAISIKNLARTKVATMRPVDDPWDDSHKIYLVRKDDEPNE